MIDITSIQQLSDFYPTIKEAGLSKRWTKFKDIAPLIEGCKQNQLFDTQQIDESLLGTPIYQIKFGTGAVKVLLWSQMHGNESTATMALFDLFNWLSCKEYADWTSKIRENLTLYFVPMLNPDGAEVFTRENSLGVDINRDALSLQTPESQLLMSLCKELKPDFAFNLHDQRRIFTTGIGAKPATLSFLTPSFDQEKNIDANRKRSMQLISQMNAILQHFIPDQIGRYDDSFYPRAFGDNIQKLGIPTILIESGWETDDWEKQSPRKWNFIGLVAALMDISEGIHGENYLPYFNIPENKDYLMDILIKNAMLKVNGKELKVDIGINWIEKLDHQTQTINYTGRIDGVGDLRFNRAYHEFDALGAEIWPLEGSSKTISDLIALGRMPEFRYKDINGKDVCFYPTLK